uniref:Uncharacterized protein n=1 Tax=Prevotella sp. GTC17262 TaxID=3236797 RepID=A0AB33JMQ5_9BACT
MAGFGSGWVQWEGISMCGIDYWSLYGLKVSAVHGITAKARQCCCPGLAALLFGLGSFAAKPLQ